MSDRIQIYTKQAGIKLNSLETKTLLTKGAKLFSLIKMTEEAKQYLAFNPDLAEVIEKW